MSPRRILITGATSGIGRALTRRLATHGAHVGVVGRSEDKLRDLTAELDRLAPGIPRSVFRADLSEQRQVRALASAVLDAWGEVPTVVHNAGVLFGEHGLTPDGVERQWAVNQLAPFLLTRLLADGLRRAEAPRIVIVASRAHWRGKIRWADIGRTQGYTGWGAYQQSKLANVMWGQALARWGAAIRLEVHSCHPGVVHTSLGDAHGRWYDRAAWRLLRPLMITPDQGAETPFFLATDPLKGAVSGTYWADRRVAQVSPRARRVDHQDRLWALCERQCGLEHEPLLGGLTATDH